MMVSCRGCIALKMDTIVKDLISSENGNDTEDYNEYYKFVYGCDIPECIEPIRENIDITLPDNKLNEPKNNIITNVNSIKCLFIWFNVAFEMHKPENEKYKELRKWFIQEDVASAYTLRNGYYIGKRDIHVNVSTTSWLENKGLYYCSTESSDWWK